MNDLTDEKQKEVKEAFDLYDKDKDSFLNFEEIECVSKCLGYTFDKIQIYNILKEHGTLKNSESNEKFLSYKEMINFLSKRSQEFDMEEELIETFKNFDKDGDGKLSHKEIKYLLLTMGEQLLDEEIDELINEIDTSGEGVIHYEDFVKLLLYK